MQIETTECSPVITHAAKCSGRIFVRQKLNVKEKLHPQVLWFILQISGQKLTWIYVCMLVFMYGCANDVKNFACTSHFSLRKETAGKANVDGMLH